MHCWRRSCLPEPARLSHRRLVPGEQDMQSVGRSPKGGMNIFAEYLITSCPFRSRPAAAAVRLYAISPPLPRALSVSHIISQIEP